MTASTEGYKPSAVAKVALDGIQGVLEVMEPYLSECKTTFGAWGRERVMELNRLTWQIAEEDEKERQRMAEAILEESKRLAQVVTEVKEERDHNWEKAQEWKTKGERFIGERDAAKERCRELARTALQLTSERDAALENVRGWEDKAVQLAKESEAEKEANAALTRERNALAIAAAADSVEIQRLKEKIHWITKERNTALERVDELSKEKVALQKERDELVLFKGYVNQLIDERDSALAKVNQLAAMIASEEEVQTLEKKVSELEKERDELIRVVGRSASVVEKATGEISELWSDYPISVKGVLSNQLGKLRLAADVLSRRVTSSLKLPETLLLALEDTLRALDSHIDMETMMEDLGIPNPPLKQLQELREALGEAEAALPAKEDQQEEWSDPPVGIRRGTLPPLEVPPLQAMFIHAPYIPVFTHQDGASAIMGVASAVLAVSNEIAERAIGSDNQHSPLANFLRDKDERLRSVVDRLHEIEERIQEWPSKMVVSENHVRLIEGLQEANEKLADEVLELRKELISLRADANSHQNDGPCASSCEVACQAMAEFGPVDEETGLRKLTEKEEQDLWNTLLVYAITLMEIQRCHISEQMRVDIRADMVTRQAREVVGHLNLKSDRFDIPDEL